MTVRVLLVDDQDLVRSGLRVMLDSEPDIEVVAEAADGAQAIEQADRHLVDVVLMDVQMPTMDGLVTTRRLLATKREPRLRIVMLTTFDLDEYVYQALRAGAAGYLLKAIRPEELATAIRTVAAARGLHPQGRTELIHKGDSLLKERCPLRPARGKERS